jgi:hypothetical protein
MSFFHIAASAEFLVASSSGRELATRTPNEPSYSLTADSRKVKTMSVFSFSTISDGVLAGT